MTDTPWQAFAAWRSGNLLATAAAQTLQPGVGQVLYTGQLSTWASVHLRVIPSAGYGTVKMNWYADQAMTQLVGVDPTDLAATSSLAMFLPVKGPYGKLTMDVTSPGAMTAQLYLAGINNSVGRFFYPVTEQTLDAENTTVPALATVYNTLPFITRGVGYLSFNPHDNSGQLALQSVLLTPAGTLKTTLARLGAPAALTNYQIGIPDGLWALAVTNNDAINSHAFDLGAIVIQGT